MKDTYFFLDFDGVVCDSVPECFLSSYQAYHVLLRGEEVSKIPIAEKNLFYAYRPFIRSGEDYILIHDLIRRGFTVTSQQAFDAEIEKTGKDVLDTYKELFYAAREAVLKTDRDFWLELNRLFEGMKDFLSSVALHPRFYILSTKKPEYIQEILMHHGVVWETPRILFADFRTKKEIIESVLPIGKGCEAYFVDDQLDHLLVAGRNSAIKPFLAVWGYVKKEWLEQKNVPLLDRPGLDRITEGFILPVSPRARPL